MDIGLITSELGKLSRFPPRALRKYTIQEKTSTNSYEIVCFGLESYYMGYLRNAIEIILSRFSSTGFISDVYYQTAGVRITISLKLCK